jgi:hypothetical protein
LSNIYKILSSEWISEKVYESFKDHQEEKKNYKITDQTLKEWNFFKSSKHTNSVNRTEVYRVLAAQHAPII